jgi:ligand-binding sensor domain-containing protein
MAAFPGALPRYRSLEDPMRLPLLPLLAACIAAIPVSAQSGNPALKSLADTPDLRAFNMAGGTAWFGTSAGLVSLERATGKSKWFYVADFQDARFVTAVERDGADGIWALANKSVWRFDGKSWSKAGRSGTSMLKLKDGSLAVCGKDSVYWYRAGVWNSIPHLPDYKGTAEVFGSAMAEGKDGSLWVNTDWGESDVGIGSVIQHIDVSQARVLQRVGGPKDGGGNAWTHINPIDEIATDSKGNLWALNFWGIYRVADTGLVDNLSKFLPDARLNCFATAPSGVVWVGSSEGIFTWDPDRDVPAGPMLRPDPNGEFDAYLMGFDAEGSLWVAGTGMLASYSGNAWNRLEIPAGLAAVRNYNGTGRRRGLVFPGADARIGAGVTSQDLLGRTRKAAAPAKQVSVR